MSPLTVPFITILVTSTRPSMKPLSLTDRAPPSAAELRTLPLMRPSRCRPPANSRSPWRFAALPRRVSIRIEFCFRRPNMFRSRTALLRIDAPHVRLLDGSGPTPVRPDFDQELFGFHARGHGDFLFDVLEITKREGYLTALAARECREIRTPGLAIHFAIDDQDNDAAHHRVRLHGLDQRDADSKLVCRGRRHHTRLLDFYLGRVRILGDDPPEEGQFLVRPGHLGLQVADRALHLFPLPGLSDRRGFELRDPGAKLEDGRLVRLDFRTQRAALLERRQRVETRAVAAELEHAVDAARDDEHEYDDGDPA